MSGGFKTGLPVFDSLTGADAREADKDQKAAEKRWEQIYNDLAPYLPTSQQLMPQYSYQGMPSPGLLSSSYANELWQRPQQGMFFGDMEIPGDFLPGGGTLPDYGDYGDLGVPTGPIMPDYEGRVQPYRPPVQSGPVYTSTTGEPVVPGGVNPTTYLGVPAGSDISSDFVPNLEGLDLSGLTGGEAAAGAPRSTPPVNKGWNSSRSLSPSLLGNIEGGKPQTSDEALAKNRYGMTLDQIREISKKAGLDKLTPAPKPTPQSTTLKGVQPQDYLSGRTIQEKMVQQLGQMAGTGVSPSSQYNQARDASMSSMGNLQDMAKAGAPMSSDYLSARDSSNRGLKALEDLVSRGIDLSGDTYQQGLGAQNDYLGRVKALADNRSLSEADLAQLAKGARDIGTESSRQRAAVRSAAESRGVGIGLASLADELLATQAGANQYGDLYANMQGIAQQRALNALKDYGLTSESMRKQAFQEAQAQRELNQKSAESAAGYADRLRSGLASEEDMYGRRALDTATAAADYANRVRSGLAGEEETYGRRALDTTTKAADFAQQLRDQAFKEKQYDIDYLRKMQETNAQTAKDLRSDDINYLRGIQSTNYDLRNQAADRVPQAIQQAWGNRLNLGNLKAGLPQFQAQSAFTAGQNADDRTVAYYNTLSKMAAGGGGAA